MPIAKISPLPSPASLKDHAYNIIKDAILSLELKPGEALVESELAERLRISKTPVRDALMELRREGLVVRIPYSGTYVSEITTRDATEIIQIRAVLEGLAARLATPSLTNAELRNLESFIESEERAMEQGEIELASRLNQQFHDLIISKTDNQRLVAILSNFENQLRRFRTLSSQLKGRLPKSAQEHRLILAALRERNAPLAETMFRNHMDSVLQDLSEDGVQKVFAGEQVVS